MEQPGAVPTAADDPTPRLKKMVDCFVSSLHFLKTKRFKRKLPDSIQGPARSLKIQTEQKGCEYNRRYS
jgi:hypothetical protein